MTRDQVLYVGIGGRMRNGKDTFAGYVVDWLYENHVWGICRGFAWELKDEVAHFLTEALKGCLLFPDSEGYRYDVIRRCLDSADPAEKEPFRLLMQWWGVEYRRNMFGEDYWIRRLEHWAVNEVTVKGGPLVVVVPDCRMPNEIAFCKQNKGVAVRVVRPGVSETDGHATEALLDKITSWDRIILNDGDLSSLKEKANSFCEHVLAKRLRIKT